MCEWDLEAGVLLSLTPSVSKRLMSLAEAEKTHTTTRCSERASATHPTPPLGPPPIHLSSKKTPSRAVACGSVRCPFCGHMWGCGIAEHPEEEAEEKSIWLGSENSVLLARADGSQKRDTWGEERKSEDRYICEGPGKGAPPTPPLTCARSARHGYRRDVFIYYSGARGMPLAPCELSKFNNNLSKAFHTNSTLYINTITITLLYAIAIFTLYCFQLSSFVRIVCRCFVPGLNMFLHVDNKVQKLFFFAKPFTILLLFCSGMEN